MDALDIVGPSIFIDLFETRPKLVYNPNLALIIGFARTSVYLHVVKIIQNSESIVLQFTKPSYALELWTTRLALRHGEQRFGKDEKLCLNLEMLRRPAGS